MKKVGKHPLMKDCQTSIKLLRKKWCNLPFHRYNKCPTQF